MKLLLVPGFSVGNKEGVDNLELAFKDKFSIEKIYWNHWQNGSQELDTQNELLKLQKAIGDDQVYVIAKSIGTWLMVKILADKTSNIKKLILTGIPLKGIIKDNNTADYFSLSNYPADQVVVFQNVNDPWGSHQEVEGFVKSINDQIEVKSMPREDHAYPYPEEFAKFLL